MTEPRTASASFDPALRSLMIVVVLGATMTILDTTITTVAVNTLGIRFDASLSSVQWVLTGYTLALSMSIPLSGWAIQRFGPKTMWIASLLLFILGSMLCGIAWNITVLIAFRLIQGFGAGMILPIGQTMLARAAGQDRMGRAMSAVAVPSMLAPVLGPVLGGVILDHLSWRWMFFINLPLCAVAVVAAIRLLPRDGVRHHDSSRLDVVGLALLSPSLGALVYGTSQIGAGTTWTDLRVAGSLSAGAALLGCYALHARRMGGAALVDIRLLRNRNFAATNAVVFAYIGAISGLMALLPLYFQIIEDRTPLWSGLLVAPLGLGAMVAMPITGRLTDTRSPRLLVLTGLPVALIGILGLTLMSSSTGTALVVVTLFVIGIGHGMITPAVMSAAYRTLKRADIPAATTAVNVTLRTASSFGVAALLVLLQRTTEPAGQPLTCGATAQTDPTCDIAQAFTQTYWWAAAIAAAALIPAVMLTRPSPPPSAPSAALPDTADTSPTITSGDPAEK